MTKKREMTAWYGKLGDAEKYPDVKHWQSQPDAKKFSVVKILRPYFY